MSKPTTEPRPISGLTRALRIVLMIALPFMLLCCVGYGMHAVAAHRFASDVYLTAEDFFPGSEPALYTYGLASLILILLQLVAGFMALKWTYRANVNAHAMSRGIETSPAWSLWWWFIPFACLFKPFAVLSEVWRSADEPDRWRGLKVPALLRWWWGFHLFGGFVSVAATAMDRSTTTAGHLVLTDLAFILVWGVQFLATLLYIRVIGRIGVAQTRLIDQGRRRPEAAIAPAWSA